MYWSHAWGHLTIEERTEIDKLKTRDYYDWNSFFTALSKGKYPKTAVCNRLRELTMIERLTREYKTN